MTSCDIMYTGSGATPGGCHTVESFLAATKKLGKSCRNAKDRVCIEAKIERTGATEARALPYYFEMPKKIQNALKKYWSEEELQNNALIATLDGRIGIVKTNIIDFPSKVLRDYIKTLDF